MCNPLMRYQALVAAVDAGAIPASALNELGDDGDDGAILGEGHDEERTGTRYNVRLCPRRFLLLA